MMWRALASTRYFHTFLWFLLGYALVILALSRQGSAQFEHLHLVIDTSVGILSTLLAVFLLSEQYNLEDRVRRYLVIGFSFAAFTEVLHTLVGIEWVGALAWIQQYSSIFRPATWPPSTYALPIAIAWLLWLERRKSLFDPSRFAAGMAVVTAVLLVLSLALPRYVDTGILGIQRPTQVPLLVLWAVVIAMCWRIRGKHPLYEGMAWMGAMLLLSDVCMLYSTSPHEKFTMMAHSGKVVSYLLLHVIQMRIAADDSHVRRVMETELKSHHDQLEAVVAERTAEAVRARGEAERANYAKSVFLANMSHELRTPLHAILSFSDLGKSRSVDSADPAIQKLHQHFDRISDSGHRLMALFNDLLDLAKLDAGKMSLHARPNNLKEMITKACKAFELLAEDKAIKLDFESVPSGIVVRCDRDRIGQVMDNLLSNAIKFSPAGSTVTVTAEPIEIPGRRTGDANHAGVVVRVRDEGVGIPIDELEAVFDKFVQSSRTVTGAGGTGLGLSICREIIELHGGAIHAERNLERGTSLVFTLPLGMPVFVESISSGVNA